MLLIEQCAVCLRAVGNHIIELLNAMSFIVVLPTDPLSAALLWEALVSVSERLASNSH